MNEYMLNTEDICSKWGFEDGDIFFDWVYDHEYILRGLVRAKDLLTVVVLMEVVPQISNDISLARIETIHNPIRAASVDGVPVRWREQGDSYNLPKLCPEVVIVSDKTIKECAGWLIKLRAGVGLGVD